MRAIGVFAALIVLATLAMWAVEGLVMVWWYKRGGKW